MHPKVFESFLRQLNEKGCRLSADDQAAVIGLVRDDILYQYTDRLISYVDTILEIDPSLSEKEIVQALLRNVVEYLGVDAATIRVYEPGSQAMVLYGSFPEEAFRLIEEIPLDNTVTGGVIKTRKVCFISDILEDGSFWNKDVAQRLGIRSMLAIPISLPRFSLKDIDTEGVLSLYYKEKHLKSSPTETKVAEMFSRRVSYVIARKRILDLQQLNEAKDRIVEQIFLKIGRREGVKMKEVFDLVIPELAGIMKIRRCVLFSLMEDQEHMILEAGYPEKKHGIGKVFSVHEPYIDALLNPRGPFGDFENEEIHRDYILVKNPQASRLLSAPLKILLASQGVRAVLYIPLRVHEEMKYFLAFDAESQQQSFRRENIEIFTFLGKELMKGLRLEKMDDIVHDFKNPAIAVAGFARRTKKMLQEGGFPSKEEKILQYLDIIIQETSRIQDMALSLYGEGKEGIVDLADRLQKRFLINAETIQELKREKIHLQQKGFESPLWVRCFPIHMDRVFDNLLDNATQAIPGEGGELSIRAYRQDSWAVAEIMNTGQISPEERDRILRGEVRGRGLHITHRFVKLMGGTIELLMGQGRTTFRVFLPLFQA